MHGYTPLFSSIVTSSIWTEDDVTRLVWITMLALADANGRVEGSIPGLAQVAHVGLEACEKAIEKLKSPDRYSRTQEHEGRRICDIEGGWLIYNHSRFRERAKSRAAYMRKYRAGRHEKEKAPQTPKKKDKLQTPNTNTNSVTGVTLHVTDVTSKQETDFDDFWTTYPRKVGKGAARRAWEKIRPSAELVARMIAAVNCQKASEQWTKDGGQFIPHPATWLNQERWDDEVKAERASGTKLPVIGPDGLTARERTLRFIEQTRGAKT